ncbi:MAG: thiamine pyrophosphate-dependent dehydrogenase E1 component subunit alpha [Myxococcota bacterium]
MAKSKESITESAGRARKARNGRAPDVTPSQVPVEQLRAMHAALVRTRLVEQHLAEGIAQGKLVGPLHAALGQEGAVVGSVIHTAKDDWICPTQRELGAHLMRGLPLVDVVAQFQGAAQSPSRGRTGHTHLGSLALHTTPPLGPTADNFAVGAGIALSFRVRKQKQVALGFFGDGVMNTGTWHEAINLVAAQGLPYVMLCNNNGFAGGTATELDCLLPDLATRAEAYGVPFESVDGCDVEAVYLACQRAFERARSGGGGTLVECKTIRAGGHTTDEVDDYAERVRRCRRSDEDVLCRLEHRLAELGILDENGLKAVEERVETEWRDAVQEAVKRAPATGVDGLTDVYAAMELTGDARTGVHYRIRS